MKKKKNVLVRLDGKLKKINERLNVQEATVTKNGITDEDNYDYGLFSAKDTNNNDSKKIVDLQKRKQQIQENARPYWDDGKSEHSPRLPPGNRKKQKNLPWEKFSLRFFGNMVFLSIAAAVLVGGAFGMSLLALFTHDANKDETSSISTVEGQPAVSMEGSREMLQPIPALDVYLVQGGAFTTAEKGKEMAGTLREIDRPTMIIEQDETHYLFIGFAADREGAEALATHYQDSGQETYVKPFAILADHLRVDEDVYSFMTAGVYWMERAAQVAVHDIAGATPTDEEVSRLFDAGQAWQDAYENLSITDEQVKTMTDNWIQGSLPVMAVYSTEVTTSSFAWEIQDALLDGMTNYQELIKILETYEQS